MGCCHGKDKDPGYIESPCVDSSEYDSSTSKTNGHQQERSEHSSESNCKAQLMSDKSKGYGSNDNVTCNATNDNIPGKDLAVTIEQDDDDDDDDDDDEHRSIGRADDRSDIQVGGDQGGSKCNLYMAESIRNLESSITNDIICEADRPILEVTAPPPTTVTLPVPPTSTIPTTTNKAPPFNAPPSSAGPYYSYHSIVNGRYYITESRELQSQPDHYNEDRVFFINDDSSAMAVFDGHDGVKASAFVEQYLYSKLINPDVVEGLRYDPKATLVALIHEVEQEFFKKINNYILEREEIQSTLPKGISSYEAYSLYPGKVDRLQEIEPELAGGTTAVIAVIVDGRLYVANVGDSRAVVVYKSGDIKQISVDHCVENKDELLRLKDLGLDIEQIKRNGRLGSHENTRSIGDYNIKNGYKDVDILSSATGPPGIATPAIAGPIAIDKIEYILLMTDGVYKTIESLTDPPTTDPNPKLLQLIKEAENKQLPLKDIATVVLDRIRLSHEEVYYNNGVDDPRSTLAVQCRKRDDMTLLVLHL